MRLQFSLLAATLLFSLTLSAQRDLVYVTDVHGWQSTVAFDGKVLLAGYDTYFGAFSDEDGLTWYNYPILDGDQLLYRAATNHAPVLYNSAVYFLLGKYFETDRYLYRFDGTSFNPVSIPGIIQSRPVVFGAHLYVLSQSGATVQLYRYDGATITAVPSGTLPLTGNYRLMVAGDYLYLVGQGDLAGDPNIIKQFNGTSFTTLPDFDFNSGISHIYHVGSDAYIVIDDSRLLYYNGSTITTVYDVPWSYIHAAVWRSQFYFLATPNLSPVEQPLYRVNAGVVTEIALPPGSKMFNNTGLTLYNDALYLPVSYSATDNRVLRYDGAGFTDIFVVPGTYSRSMDIFTRGDDLVIQPEWSDAPAYEYDGSTFTQLRVPEPHVFLHYLNSTCCNHLWLDLYYYDDGESDPWRWGLLREPIECPPPVTPGVPVIPEHFFDLERADLKLLGKERGWCWSEISIDWAIKPCDFPEPCPDPLYQLKMYNKDNKLAWQKKIEKPSVLAVPLKDDQPYSARLSSETGQKEDLFLFAGNLVEKGIESISISMKPGDNFFKIVATTDKSTPVAFRVELLSKSGEVLWVKDFVAPFSEQISDRIKEPGQTLRFSTPGKEELKTVITQLGIYPNPSKGQLNVQVKSGNKIDQAELSITTLLGQQVIRRKIAIPFNQPLSLDNIKPGIYVIKIVTGREVVSRIIRIE